VTPEAWLVAIPIGLLAANILVVNNYRDVETDAAANKRTLVVRFGRGFARTQFALSLAVALLAPVALWVRGLSPATLLPWLLLPLARKHYVRLRDAKTPAELIALLGDTGKLLAWYALLLTVGLIFRR
jgi:1,4-dihydroxy-2-naphthoate octaprenyltransferase